MNLRNYIYSHCVNPVKVRMFDAYSQQFVVRELPCGKCLHCQNTRVSDWCTRLIAQKKFSKYTYYVSLDYAPFNEASAVSMQLAYETAACYNDCNKNKSYGLHPLVLCKNHLQDFFKRLRKNTGIKLQYFACGEYGMHANGRGYGRPHYHCIIFSNDCISNEEFERAWSVFDYKIGRVDIVDMSCSSLENQDNLKIFRYVCKYIQKTNFVFDSLATIDYHRAYFKSLQYVLEKTDTLFPERVPITDSRTLEFNWSEYTKLHSPFIVCSRRPSIGSDYLAENMERFTQQDFRLFGLPNICTTFPRYYVRRAKEEIYSYSALGRVSKVPSSAARMGSISQILSYLLHTKLSIDNWSEKPAYNWSVCKQSYTTERITEGELILVLNGDLSRAIPCSDLSFYDRKNKFMYQFDGYSYNVWAKYGRGLYAKFDRMEIEEVLSEISPSWYHYRKTYLELIENARVQSEKLLSDTIRALYPAETLEDSYSLFYKDVQYRYSVELDTIYKTKKLMSNSKLTL